jgi:hypothetical protein
MRPLPPLLPPALEYQRGDQLQPKGVRMSVHPRAWSRYEAQIHRVAICPCDLCTLEVSVWIKGTRTDTVRRLFGRIEPAFLCRDCDLHGHMVALEWK